MSPDDLSFWDHVHELRKYLIRSVLVFIALFVAAFSFREILFDGFLLALLDNDFITYRLFDQLSKALGLAQSGPITLDFQLINIKLAGQFMAHISISALAAGILTLPFLVFQLWLFVKPALYQHERKMIRRNVWLLVILFLTGCFFAYYILTPLSVLFLGNYQVSERVINTIALSSYLSVFSTTMILSGLVFELPVLLNILNRLNIVSAAVLRKYRKHAIVAGLILSAIITPTTDPFTMSIVAIPLYLLFELSILNISIKEKRHARENQD